MLTGIVYREKFPGIEIDCVILDNNDAAFPLSEIKRVLKLSNESEEGINVISVNLPSLYGRGMPRLIDCRLEQVIERVPVPCVSFSDTVNLLIALSSSNEVAKKWLHIISLYGICSMTRYNQETVKAGSPYV